ncbi:MAG: DUF3887 domain-containing protein [Methanoculleus sp.]
MNPLLLPILVVLILVVSVSGCIGQETVISGEEAAEVLAYADPAAENLLTGLNEGNYAAYSRDFSAEMREAIDETVFEQNREFVVSRIGFYKSRDDPVVTEVGDYVAVTYRAKFEREDGVVLRFAFKEDDPAHRLHGLWFNSPKLRG